MRNDCWDRGGSANYRFLYLVTFYVCFKIFPVKTLKVETNCFVRPRVDVVFSITNKSITGECAAIVPQSDLSCVICDVGRRGVLHGAMLSCSFFILLIILSRRGPNHIFLFHACAPSGNAQTGVSFKSSVSACSNKLGMKTQDYGKVLMKD